MLENKELSGDKAQIEDNQELYAATPSDPNVHLMVDADTAPGDEDAYKTKLNSPSKVPPIASEEKSIIFSPKLHDSSMVHKEMETETSLPLKGERDSIGTCEDEVMLKLSEKACIVEDPEGQECIRFSPNELDASTTKGCEADTYFDQTTLCKLFDNSDVGGVEDEINSTTTSNKKKRNDVVDTNSDEEVKADELVPTVSQSSEMMSCTFSLQQLFASDELVQAVPQPKEMESMSYSFSLQQLFASGTAGGNADVCEVKSASSQQMKFPSERSDYDVGSFNLEENKEMSGDKAQIEDNQELYAATPSDHGTAGGNADVCEVKSASSQQMKFPSERSDYDVGSFNLEENKEMSGDKAQIEDNQELYAATPSDPNVHLMVDSGTVAGIADACEVKSASTQQTSQAEEEPKMKLQCKRSENNVGSFLEETMQKSDNKEHIEDNQELSPATRTDLDVLHMVDSDTASGDEDAYKMELNSPSKVLTVASEEKSIIFSPKLHDSSMVHKEMDIETSLPLKCERDSIDTCEEAEMLKLSEKACMGEECIRFPPNELEASTTKGSEADTYFDQTTLSKLFDNSDVGGVEDENHSSTTRTKRKRSDVDDTNSDEEVKADEFVPTVSQSSEMMSCTFSLQQLFASDTCEEEMLNLSEKEKTCMVADLDACIGFPPNDLEAATTYGSQDDKYFDPTILRNVVTETCRFDKVEKENNEEDCLSAQGEVSKLFDNSDVYDDISCVGAEVENQSHMTSRKRKNSDEDDTSANSDEDVKADELVPIVPPPSETESCNFSLQQLFASDTCEEEMLNLSEKDKTCMVADLEACIGFPLNDLEAATTKCSEEDKYFDPTILRNVVTDTCRDDKVEREINQEDCLLAQGEVSKFVENSDVYEDISVVGAEAENQSHVTGQKRKSSGEGDTSANSDEDVKEDELVRIVPPPSETESCNFSLQQLFASDTCEEEMLNLSEKEKTCMVADLEACIGFLPNDLEAATTNGSQDDKYFDPTIIRNVVMEACTVDKVEKENKQEDCLLAHGEVSMLVDNSDVYDDISGVGAEAENQSHITSQKRKSSDEDDTSANSDEDVRADELVPIVPPPSETESCNFILQQLFASDTASGEEVAYKTSLDSPSKATPIASGEKSMIFSPKLKTSLPQKLERDNSIEMSLPQKRERDNSVGTCDMKENINIDKKAEIGSMMSKTKFAKRQPLQDLQQN
ncbi:hypothetical protein P8452_50775 [Trifolium repens]|nr:hypothetical protein P8452_50775 [Trifolium repens]